MGIVLGFCLLFVMPYSASALPLIQDYFTRIGQSESVAAPLNVFGGSTTTQQWSGLIEVIASGSGVNVPGTHEDSFYPFDPNSPGTPTQGPGILPPQGLRLSFNGCAASAECGAPRISDFFIFVDGVGFVSPPAEITIDSFLGVIPYSRTHVYHFVIDIGPNLHFLTLREGDGGVFDNSGEFDVQLFGVDRTRSVPEPSSLVLVSVGAVALFTMRISLSEC